MAGLQIQCPLDPYVMLHSPSSRMDLAHVKEIEQHVLSAGPCIHPPLKDIVLHPPLKDIVLHGRFEGSTPLLHACQEGHLEAVQHIVEDWHVDVRASGILYGGAHGITPLFVAAYEGHSDIVEYLISKGADVSAVTSTAGDLKYASITPLHAALMMWGVNEIARILLDAGADPSTLAFDGTPVWMKRYCGVDATTALVNRGLDLNLRNCKGETILHYWSKSLERITEEERLKVVRLLVDRGADLKTQDHAGVTPILASAESKSFDVFDLLFEKDVLDRRQQIDALELAGSYLLLDLDPNNRDKGCDFWRRASQLREESPPILKNPLKNSSGRTVEWATSEDLEKVIDSEYWIQSMFTRLRIYCDMRNLEAVSYLSDDFYYSDFEPDQKEPSDQDVVTVFWGYLEVVRGFYPLDYLHPNIKMNINLAVMELTSMLPSLLQNDPLRNVENIQRILDLILVVVPDYSGLGSEFFDVLAGLPLALRPSIRKLLSQSARNDATIIPKALYEENWNTLRLLLHLGAVQKKFPWFGRRNTPLHVLAEMDETPVRSAAANLLFYYGANPNQMNDQGETAVDLWVTKYCGEEGMRSVKWNDQPDWCRDTVPKLSRLCVRTVHIHGVPFDEEHASLPPFQELPKSV